MSPTARLADASRLRRSSNSDRIAEVTISAMSLLARTAESTLIGAVNMTGRTALAGVIRATGVAR